jgi:hypothetical protein
LTNEEDEGMATLQERREQTPDLYWTAIAVAFGDVDAVTAARVSCAGSVEAANDLSERDRQLLAIGALAGAGAAIACARFPFETPDDTLERTDILMDYAASVGCCDDHGAVLFDDIEAVA